MILINIHYSGGRHKVHKHTVGLSAELNKGEHLKNLYIIRMLESVPDTAFNVPCELDMLLLLISMIKAAN